jgi:hypothetical protein
MANGFGKWNVAAFLLDSGRKGKAPMQVRIDASRSDGGELTASLHVRAAGNRSREGSFECFAKIRSASFRVGRTALYFREGFTCTSRSRLSVLQGRVTRAA